ncbi:hypothetical protein [Halopseudomonas salina]|uniref:Uncharacterized protein n=1 Tax=Halopseudomonas salina TaxID=1323744 RepID=A0ABQ1P288_9GAMM|nr:hypothetical protein [Halopseudomonas salina]GGC88913.1 hypothetical protein GCM10007418_05710 [Halopseudomonas salina]
MTEHLPLEQTVAKNTDSIETHAKTEVPAFKFPFAPANFAPKQAPAQPWHQKGSNARHEKKIGMAPKGTRRSMGKR